MHSKLTRRVRTCIVAAGLVALPTLVVGAGTAHADGPTCSVVFDKSSYDIYTANLEDNTDNNGTVTLTGSGFSSPTVWIRADSGSWHGPYPGDGFPNGVTPLSTVQLAGLFQAAGIFSPGEGTYHLYYVVQEGSIQPYSNTNDVCTADLSVTVHSGLPPTGSNASPMVFLALGLFGAGAALLVIRRTRVRSIA